ncbi:MAG: endonuclease/exonuclease/phosphatase family protein [bacterium]|nr:endonuclease/exonuclease/phosphatase family protein [bacterium]
MELFFWITGIIGIVVTALPLSKSDRWWVRVFDFPRLQILALLVVSVVGISAFALSRPFSTPDWAFASLLVLSLVYQCYMMFPYTPFARKQVEQSVQAKNGSTVSLLFSNVLMQNQKFEGLLRSVRDSDPDIVLTVETNEWWRDKLSGLEEEYQYTVLQPQENEYGMLLYSRLPLSDASVKFLVDDEIPSIHATAHLPSGHEVELRCLHPRPPFPTEDATATDRDAEVLIVGREIKGHVTGPAIVFGDLNDVAWSRTNYLFQNISGLLDPRIGRGFYNTFHAFYPAIRFPLDHFFHSKHFRLVDFRRLPYYGSDHFPVYIKLSIEGDAPAHQEELQAQSEEVAEAKEKIEKAV